MSHPSKKKGYAAEMAIVKSLLQSGIPAERVPLSGSIPGQQYHGDIAIPSVAQRRFTAEVKKRKTGEGFKVLEQWMGGKDILFLKRNNQDPMVVVTYDLFVKMLNKYLGDNGEV